MGTSASSNGPGSGVSLDPPWLDDIGDDNVASSPSENDVNGNSQGVSQPEEPQQISPIAPKGRFSSARRNMGEYVRSGSRDSLRRSLGHYSKTGMGGAKAASQRMRVSARVGANLFNTFRSLRDDPNFSLGKALSDLKARGADARQIIRAIVEQVCPRGGSLDEISLKNSATSALSEYLEEHPDIDFTSLSDDQMWELTGTYLGNEIFERVQMDIGQAFERVDISFAERVNRLNDMKAFIQTDVSVQLNRIRDTESKTVNIQKLIQNTIRATFEIYEGAV